MKKKSLFVTRPSFPAPEKLMPLIEEIHESRLLSNYGPIHQRFEAALCDYLGVEHVSLVSNATLGSIVALRHLAGGGQVITTPFSFVATSHSIMWAGCEPVFVDIDPVTLNLDAAAVERAITPETKAIVAVHCYGIPCDVDALADVARRHGLPLIYDAAHAFGVRKGSRSVLEYGDVSVLSFHATKIFNTLEGGAVVCRDRETKDAVDRMVNHGIVDETNVDMIGINAKMNELNAAVGLLQLPTIDAEIAARGVVSQRYWAGFRGINGVRSVCQSDRKGHNNYAFPIMVGPGYPMSRDDLYSRLKADGIFARRYFHPLISDLPMYRNLPSADPEGLPVARDASDRILCLPIHPELSAADQQRVIDVVANP